MYQLSILLQFIGRCPRSNKLKAKAALDASGHEVRPLLFSAFLIIYDIDFTYRTAGAIAANARFFECSGWLLNTSHHDW